MLRVENGAIVNEDNSIMINEPAIVIDKDCGSVMKYGNKDRVSEYYRTAVSKYTQMGFVDMAENLVFIDFDRYNSEISIDDICTIINYGMNCHAESFTELFSLNAQTLKDRLEQLRKYGY